MTPVETTGFAPKHAALLEYLDRKNVDFWFSKKVQVSAAPSGSVEVVMADDVPVLVMVSEGTTLDLDAVSKALRARSVRLAKKEDLMAHAVRPIPPAGFGKLLGVALVCDGALLEEARVRIPSGIPDLYVELDTDDFVKLEKPVVANLTTAARAQRRIA
jgi:prolyl-tRNA editing enzyme YbaK/EbsC (Cys-tRNA(Pro) deacylase)